VRVVGGRVGKLRAGEFECGGRHAVVLFDCARNGWDSEFLREGNNL